MLKLRGCLHEGNKAQGSAALVRDPVSLSIIAEQHITCLNRVSFIAVGVGASAFVDVVHLVVARVRVHADRTARLERDARYISKLAREFAHRSRAGRDTCDLCRFARVLRVLHLDSSISDIVIPFRMW